MQWFTPYYEPIFASSDEIRPPQVVERRKKTYQSPRYLCKPGVPLPKQIPFDHSRRPLNGANPVLQSSSSAGLMGLIIPSSSIPAIGAVPCRDIGLKT